MLQRAAYLVILATCCALLPTARASDHNGVPLVTDVETRTGRHPAAAATASPVYSFRRVVSLGDRIDARRVNFLGSPLITPDGRVAMSAQMDSFGGVLVEREDGGFRWLSAAGGIGGYSVEKVYLPRFDREGNEYVSAVVREVGPVVFKNERPVLGPPGHEVRVAPIVPYTLGDTLPGVDSTSFYVLGREREGSPLSVLRIFNDGQRVDVRISVGTEIDRFSDGIIRKYEHRRLGNASRSFVAATESGILLDGALAVRRTERIGGYPLGSFLQAEIVNSGGVFFLSRTQDGVTGLFSRTASIVRDGDVVDGVEIVRLIQFDANAVGDLAFTTEVGPDFDEAVFLNDKVVAVPGTTQIDDELVSAVAATTFALNESGQVAFQAIVGGRHATVVATPTGVPEEPFSYRVALVGGQELRDGYSYREGWNLSLTDDGRVSQRITAQLGRPIAPIVAYFGYTHSFAPSGARTLLVTILPEGKRYPDISIVDVDEGRYTPFWGLDDVVDGLHVINVQNAIHQQRVITDGGQFCAHALVNSGEDAIFINNDAVVREGDVIDGRTLTGFSLPEINNGGTLIFRGSYQGGHAIFDRQSRLLGTGDPLGDQTVLSTRRATLNDAGQLAVSLERSDREKAIYCDLKPVVVTGVTDLGGELVEYLDELGWRMNEAGQVAFYAETATTDALWIATPTGQPDPPYTYRRAAAEGETIGDELLHQVTRYELTENGRATIFAAAQGDDPTRIFIESSEGVWDAWASGDDYEGYPVDRFYGPPQIDHHGNVYTRLSIQDASIVVLVNGAPLLQTPDLPSRNALVMETQPGVFDAILENEKIGDLTVQQVKPSCPRFDADGNEYLLVSTDAGETLFFNREPLVQTHHQNATAPIRLDSLYVSNGLFDVADNGDVYIFGKPEGVAGQHLIRVDPHAKTAVPILSESIQVPGWRIEEIVAGPQEDAVGAEVSAFLLRGEGREAVLHGGSVHISDGQSVKGKRLTSFSAVQQAADNPRFIADFEGGNGVFDAQHQYIATGDLVEGLEVERIESFSVGGSAATAYIAKLTDNRRAVFQDDRLIAIEGETVIDGDVVADIRPEVVRQNARGDVAFVVAVGESRRVIAAVAPGGQPPFRVPARVDEKSGTAKVQSIDDLRLDSNGWVSFVSTRTVLSTKLFRQTAEDAFDVIYDGDRIGDLRVTFSLGRATAPRVNDAGDEIISVPVEPVGQAVFVNRQPIAHGFARQPGIAPNGISLFEDDDILHCDDQGRILVYGKINPNDSLSLIRVDTVNNTVQRVLSEGERVEGERLEYFEQPRFFGFGDDGEAVIKARAGSLASIVSQHRIIARLGDIIDGRQIGQPFTPGRDPAGGVYYRADSWLMHHPPGQPGQVLVRPGSQIGDWTIRGVTSYALNDGGLAAFTTVVNDEDVAIFTVDDAVVVRGATRIEDRVVNTLAASVHANDYGQLAFLAALQGEGDAVFVATPLKPFDGNGDCRVDLADHDGLSSCLAGPSEPLERSCRIYDGNDDGRVDLLDVAIFQSVFTGDEEIEGCRP